MIPFVRPLPEKLYRLGQTVGTDEFHRAGLDLLGQLVPRDMEWILVYSRTRAPQVLHFALTQSASPEIDPDAVLEIYQSGFYRFDPFYRYWREAGRPAVIGMHAVPEGNSLNDNYLTDFMPVTCMADDIAVMLQVDDQNCVALCIERATLFTETEFAQLRSLFPLLAGLQEAHLRIARDSGNEGPTESGEPGAETPLNFERAVAAFLPTELTRREREIVRFILGGFHNDAIAAKLGIGSGTVRNHRKRLYGKLDITNERELFSLFLAYLARVDASELV